MLQWLYCLGITGPGLEPRLMTLSDVGEVGERKLELLRTEQVVRESH